MSSSTPDSTSATAAADVADAVVVVGENNVTTTSGTDDDYNNEEENHAVAAAVSGVVVSTLLASGSMNIQQIDSQDEDEHHDMIDNNNNINSNDDINSTTPETTETIRPPTTTTATTSSSNSMIVGTIGNEDEDNEQQLTSLLSMKKTSEHNISSSDKRNNASTLSYEEILEDEDYDDDEEEVIEEEDDDDVEEEVVEEDDDDIEEVVVEEMEESDAGYEEEVFSDDEMIVPVNSSGSEQQQQQQDVDDVMIETSTNEDMIPNEQVQIQQEEAMMMTMKSTSDANHNEEIVNVHSHEDTELTTANSITTPIVKDDILTPIISNRMGSSGTPPPPEPTTFLPVIEETATGTAIVDTTTHPVGVVENNTVMAGITTGSSHNSAAAAAVDLPMKDDSTTKAVTNVTPTETAAATTEASTAGAAVVSKDMMTDNATTTASVPTIATSTTTSPTIATTSSVGEVPATTTTTTTTTTTNTDTTLSDSLLGTSATGAFPVDPPEIVTPPVQPPIPLDPPEQKTGTVMNSSSTTSNNNENMVNITGLQIDPLLGTISSLPVTTTTTTGVAPAAPIPVTTTIAEETKSISGLPPSSPIRDKSISKSQKEKRSLLSRIFSGSNKSITSPTTPTSAPTATVTTAPVAPQHLNNDESNNIMKENDCVPDNEDTTIPRRPSLLEVTQTAATTSKNNLSTSSLKPYDEKLDDDFSERSSSFVEPSSISQRGLGGGGEGGNKNVITMTTLMAGKSAIVQSQSMDSIPDSPTAQPQGTTSANTTPTAAVAAAAAPAPAPAINTSASPITKEEDARFDVDWGDATETVTPTTIAPQPPTTTETTTAPPTRTRTIPPPPPSKTTATPPPASATNQTPNSNNSVPVVAVAATLPAAIKTLPDRPPTTTKPITVGGGGGISTSSVGVGGTPNDIESGTLRNSVPPIPQSNLSTNGNVSEMPMGIPSTTPPPFSTTTTATRKGYQGLNDNDEQRFIAAGTTTSDGNQTTSTPPNKKANLLVLLAFLLTLLVIVLIVTIIIWPRNNDDDGDREIKPRTLSPTYSSPTITPLQPTTTQSPTVDVLLPVWTDTLETLSGAQGSGLGASITTDSNFLAVGAPNLLNGSVYTFQYANNAWNILNQLSGMENNSQFGFSTDIGNSKLIVGSPYTSINNTFVPAGSVQVYDFSTASNEWSNLGGMIRGENDIYAANEEFGYDVATATDASTASTLLAVGAPKSNKGNLTHVGRVYTFRQATNNGNVTWESIEGTATPIVGTVPNGLFGTSVDLSKDGTRFIVGAPGGDNSTSDFGGYVHIYAWTGSQWELEFERVGSAGERLGTSVVLLSPSGNQFAVGGPGYENNAGRISVFQLQDRFSRQAGLVTQLGADIIGKPGERLGARNSLIGGTFQSGTTIFYSTGFGTVKTYRFEEDSSTWQPTFEELGTNANNSSTAVLGFSEIGTGSLLVGVPDDDTLNAFSVGASVTSAPVTTSTITTGTPTTASPTTLFIPPVGLGSTSPVAAATNVPGPTPNTTTTTAPVPTATSTVPGPTSPTMTSVPGPTIMNTTFAPIPTSINTIVPKTESPTTPPLFALVPTQAPVLGTNSPDGTLPSGSSWLQFGGNFNPRESGWGYGTSVALGNSNLAIGAPKAVENGAVFTHEYDSTNSVWELKATNQLFGEEAGSQFGASVDMIDGLLVVGAPALKVTATSTKAGAAYCYNKSGSDWIQIGNTLRGDPGVYAADEEFGAAVALSNNFWIIVGAPGSSLDLVSQRGRIYVYNINEETLDWNLVQDIAGELEQSKFGSAVDIASNGASIIAGAPGASSGYVSVYSWSGSAWVLAVSIQGSVVGEGFGTSVKMLTSTGTIIAVGAPFHEGDQGRVVIYEQDGDTYVPLGEPIVGARGDYLGSAKMVSGGGFSTPSVVLGTATGSVKRFDFDYSTSKWIQVGSTVNSGFSSLLQVTSSAVSDKFIVSGDDDTAVYELR